MGGFVPIAALESLADAGAAEIVEYDPITKKAPRVVKLTTQGLAEGIKVLRDKCAERPA